MHEHYHFERLVDYSVGDIPDTTRGVNPMHRELDSDVQKLAAQLARTRANAIKNPLR